jgi:hypothetical protein
MGAAEYPMGVGPCGLDPVAPLSAPATRLKTPAAILFDPKKKRFLMNEDGSFIEAHPVDQLVAICLGLDSRSYKSAPERGHTVWEMRTLAGPTSEAEAADRIRQALRVPLVRGDITLDSVTINPILDDPALKGRTEILVEYTNLRTPKPERRSVVGAI